MYRFGATNGGRERRICFCAKQPFLNEHVGALRSGRNSLLRISYFYAACVAGEATIIHIIQYCREDIHY